MAPDRGLSNGTVSPSFELPTDDDIDTPESETPTLERFNTTDDSSTMDGDVDSSLSLEPHSSDNDDDDDDDDDDASSSGSSSRSSPPRPGMLNHSSSSLLMHSYFAPPFYNRPPTPLPPSPSLTSLLRPSFSTTTSRPSTPDTSDGDTAGETESAVTRGARISRVVPRKSPKVPTYEYYGFVLYLMSSLFFLMYLLWSYLPAIFLAKLGIEYYPNRWWSLAIPSYLVMTIVYIYVALASYNTGYLTLPMQSIENIVDEAGHIAVLDHRGKMVKRGTYTGPGGGGGGSGKMDKGAQVQVDWRSAWSEGTDAVMDVPVGGVCEVLYGGG